MELELFSDIQLMTLFAHGREDAFGLLFVRHRDRVYRLGLRMTGDPAEAEEIVQETFLRVARSASSYSPSAQWTTWLHRVALNVTLTRLKSGRNTKVIPLFEGRSTQRAGAGADPLAAAEAYEVADQLQRALDGLDAPLRSAFVLRVCEGLSTNEAAQILDIPPATVRTHVHRARVLLRERLTRATGKPTSARGNAT